MSQKYHFQVLVVFKSGRNLKSDQVEATKEEVETSWDAVNTAFTERYGSLTFRVNGYSTAINLESVEYVTYLLDPVEDSQ